MDCASVKGRFPFRVGASSCVLRADLLTNVRYLCEYVDNVEIALFESDRVSPLPDKDTIRELAAIARDSSLSYTVHLPFDVDVGSADEGERADSVQCMLRAAESVSALAPVCYAMHWPAPGERAAENVRSRWRESLSRSARELTDAGLGPGSVCVETLDYPYEWVEDIVAAAGFSVCLDIGHIELQGAPVLTAIDKYSGKTRLIHAHGVNNGEDHHAVSFVDADVLSLLISSLGRDPNNRVLTVEVFSEDRLAESLDFLAEKVP